MKVAQKIKVTRGFNIHARYTMYPSSRISYNLISYVVFNLTQHYPGAKRRVFSKNTFKGLNHGFSNK